MSYVKREWKDRMVENPKTYNIINNSDGTVTLEDRPGAVYEEGTPISAENMNHMEEGIAEAYVSATSYTDNAIAELVGQAPEAMDTIYELAALMAQNQDMVDLLNQAVAQKAAQAELDTHTGNSTIHITASERKAWNTVSDKHTIKRYKISLQSIKNSSGSTVASISIPAGSCTGSIKIISSDLRNIQGVMHVDMGWTVTDDHALVIPYCYLSESGEISLIIWNLGQNSFTLTTGTSFNVIGWE